MTDRILRPFRRIIPPMGGLDISPIFAIILIMALTIVVAGLRPLSI
jgi:YggT family protein